MVRVDATFCATTRRLMARSAVAEQHLLVPNLSDDVLAGLVRIRPAIDMWPSSPARPARWRVDAETHANSSDTLARHTLTPHMVAC